MERKTWCIKNITHKLWWSNWFGWVTDGFSLFSDEEKEVYGLPIEGKWELFHVEEIG